jgi:hypothetical protein
MQLKIKIMKKLLVLIGAIVLFASCEKEVITPQVTKKLDRVVLEPRVKNAFGAIQEPEYGSDLYDNLINELYVNMDGAVSIGANMQSITVGKYSPSNIAYVIKEEKAFTTDQNIVMPVSFSVIAHVTKYYTDGTSEPGEDIVLSEDGVLFSFGIPKTRLIFSIYNNFF